jgi:hypothetical protein
MKIDNTTELTNFYKKNLQLQIEIQLVALKITSWRTMGEKKPKKAAKSYDVQVKQTYFWTNQG